MKLLGRLLEDQFYLGHVEGPCSYLPGRNSSLLFMDGRSIGGMYHSLLDVGYRRCGFYVYRPDCKACEECCILRIPVNCFHPTRSQRRIWKKGQAVFNHRFLRPQFSEERLNLYQLYLKNQHGFDESGGESLPREEQYKDFFIDTFLKNDTVEMQLLFEGRLVGIGIFDRVRGALSAVYFMFHPEFRSYSPGTYAILLGIEQARKWGLEYYYPGYYIKECASMSYKANYRPHEVKKI